jgi:hypothetical protein
VGGLLVMDGFETGYWTPESLDEFASDLLEEA